MQNQSKRKLLSTLKWKPLLNVRKHGKLIKPVETSLRNDVLAFSDVSLFDISSYNLFSVETSRLPSATATSTDFQQGQTSPLPKDTSLTTTTASITVTPILSSVSAISSTSSVADRLSVIAKLVPNTGIVFIAYANFISRARLNLYIPHKMILHDFQISV